MQEETWLWIFTSNSHVRNTFYLRQQNVCSWHRYVDDTFVLLHPSTNVSEILNVLNNFHPSIKFTHEVEDNYSIPFLDVLVTRSPTNNTFETTIYRKTTFTGLMINWNSFVPIEYKRADVSSMVRRALAICSTYSNLTKEFDEIRRIATNNDYPLSFIDTQIGIGLSRHLDNKNKEIKQKRRNNCTSKYRTLVKLQQL